MNHKQGFSPVILALIVALLLGGGFVVYQKVKSRNQKSEQVMPQATDNTKNWKTYRNKKYEFEFKYPPTWKQTGIFSGLGGSKNAVAFVKSSQEAELKHSLKPDTDLGAVVIQDTAFFFNSAEDDYLYTHRNENPSLITFSPIKIGTTDAQHLFHSEKTDPNKFGGGATDEYIFTKGTISIVAQANYGGPVPAGELKVVFGQVLSTFKFTDQKSAPIESSPTGEPAPQITSITPLSGSRGTMVEVRGNNLSGFEGDLDVYFERADGKKIMLTDPFDDYPKTGGSLIRIFVKESCQKGETIYGRYSGIPSQCDYVELTPGVYKVYAKPWSGVSNTVQFTVTQ